MKKILVVIPILILGSIPIHAIIAYNKNIEIIQSTGDTLFATIKGDENRKWIGTIDGYTIIEKENGVWHYATMDTNGQIKPSGILAKRESLRDQAEINYISGIPKGINSSPNTGIMITHSTQHIENFTPVIGNKKGLVILMEYTDNAFSIQKNQFDSLFNSTNYIGLSKGSVKQFFLENSFGELQYNFDIIGPFISKYQMSYYGGNSYNGNDKNPRALMKEAILNAAEFVHFSDYDNNSDGIVENVHIIFAGYGEEAGASSNAIWSHQWSLEEPLYIDGTTIENYSCAPELRGNKYTTISAVGVHCHEFCHSLGVPDFYDTDYETNGNFEGTGDWDLMASGSWNNDGDTPAHINGYAKTHILGWGSVTTLINNCQIHIDKKKNKNDFYRINTKTPNEFFLLENRNQDGFDANIPYHGMLIYRIHSNMDFSNNNLNTKHPQRCYPISANNNILIPNSNPASYGNINSNGCPFPGSTTKRMFSDDTTPSARAWSGLNSGFAISDIQENDSTLHFNFSIAADTLETFQDSTLLLQENFLTGIPNTWVQEYLLGSLPWLQIRNFENNYISIKNSNFSKSTYITRLCLPEINIQGYDFLNLKFNLLNKSILKIYWKESDNTEIELYSHTEATNTWTLISENKHDIGTTGQIIFEGLCAPGSEILLDQVELWGMKKDITSIKIPKKNQQNIPFTINGNHLTIFNNKQTDISVYSIGGFCVYKEHNKSETVHIPLPKGLYIIQLNEKSHLISIK